MTASNAGCVNIVVYSNSKGIVYLMPFARSLHHSSKSRLQQGIIQAEWSWHKKKKQTLPRYPTARFHKHLACDPRVSKEHSHDFRKRRVFYGEGRGGVSETDLPLPVGEVSGVRCPALPRGPAASRPHRRRERRRMLRPVEEEHGERLRARGGRAGGAPSAPHERGADGGLANHGRHPHSQ